MAQQLTPATFSAKWSPAELSECGYWEAKDTDDDTETEIKKKIKCGCCLTNTIFEDTREGRFYQDGKLEMITDWLDQSRKLHDGRMDFPCIDPRSSSWSG